MPQAATISSVGMQSLLSSKLYGTRLAAAVNASCSGGGTLTPASCSASTPGACTGCTGGTSPVFTPYQPAGSGPGKANFIGFGATGTGTTGCGVTIASPTHILRDATTSTDADCILNVNDYTMGVFGHLGGNDFIGHQIESTGVVTERAVTGNTSANIGTTCT